MIRRGSILQDKGLKAEPLAQRTLRVRKGCGGKRLGSDALIGKYRFDSATSELRVIRP